MVNGIGIVLCFQAKTASLLVVVSGLSILGCNKVSGVELDTGKIGINGHPASGTLVGENSYLFRLGPCGIDNPVVIVSACKLQLFVILVDTVADAGGMSEIKGCSRNCSYLAGRNTARKGGSIMRRVEPERMIHS